jgi:hypothetical protein
MPTGLPIGQTIVDDEPNGKFDDRDRVIGFWRSDVGGIDVEVFVTLTTIMHGISQMKIDGPCRVVIAEMMKFSVTNFVPGGGAFAIGAGTFFGGARATFDFGRWQIVRICDSFGRIGSILTGAGHGMFLLEFKAKKGNMPDFPVFVKINSPILPLQCLIFWGNQNPLLCFTYSSTSNKLLTEKFSLQSFKKYDSTRKFLSAFSINDAFQCI